MPRRIPPELMAVAIVIAVLSELFPIAAQCADSAADTTPRATGERRLAAYLIDSNDPPT